MGIIDVTTQLLITQFTTITIIMSMYLYLRIILANSCGGSVTKQYEIVP